MRCKHTTCETKPTKFDNFTKQDDGDNAVNTSPVPISTAYNGKIENYIQMYCNTRECYSQSNYELLGNTFE